MSSLGVLVLKLKNIIQTLPSNVKKKAAFTHFATIFSRFRTFYYRDALFTAQS